MNHPLAVSVVTALLLAVAMPGRLGWWPLLFVALLPLFSFVSHNKPGRSALVGLLTGFLYHVCLLYWIVIVLGRYGGLPLWLSVPALLLLSLYMSLYMAVFAGLLSYASRQQEDGSQTYTRIIVVAPVLWVALDWLRGILFTGFPWMDLGYGLYSLPLLIQVADLGGHHLVSFGLVLINTLVFYAVKRIRRTKQQYPVNGTRLAVAALMVLVLLGCYSILRYQNLAQQAEYAGKMSIAVVQGNIPQDEKWTPNRKISTLERYRQLSLEGIADKQSMLVIWPETALPFYPQNDPLFLQVTALPREMDAWLLTGSPYFTLSQQQGVEEPAINYFNSALMINPEGSVTERYDKKHLVPYGEYVPLRRYMPFLEPLVVSVGNFTAGSSVVPLKVGKMKAGILICYESIFPDIARNLVENGADVLVNITNDAWYGRSSAPHQSFAMSVFRSLENRRSLIRAANTGISGFVDPLGRVISDSPLFEPLVLTAEVPVFQEKTVFVRYGFLFGPFCLFITICLLFFRLKKIQFYPNSKKKKYPA